MQYFNLHTHQFSAQEEILELVNQYPLEFNEAIPWYSIGIHPWKINSETLASELDIIAEKLLMPNCLVLGECGLDKRIETPLDLQVQVFEQQLLLAEKFRKPVVIHCVAAYSELIQIKKKLQISVPMILHGFSKNAATAQQLLEHGFYLSFGKYLLRNPELSEVFKNIPDQCFFLETDTIEESITDVYLRAADCKSYSVTQIQQIIAENFQKVFIQTT